MAAESKSATSPDFGHYFAGIADGEGHFAIRRGSPKGKPGYACSFVLIMRDDDRAELFSSFLSSVSEPV